MSMENDFRDLRKSVRLLEYLSAQTAVHRKKFEYALSQIRPTVNTILEQKDSLGPKQSNLIRDLIHQLQEIQSLERQNILQTWTNTTLDYPCNFVYDELIKIFEKIRRIFMKYEPNLEIDKHIATNTEKWDQYNMYDLRAIEGSFTTCLTLTKINDDLIEKVKKKLSSIQGKLEKEAKPLVSHPMSPMPSAYQNWKVNLSNFTIIKEIGHGVSAKVFLAKDNRQGIDPSKVEVAIKRFQMEGFSGSRFQSFQREVAVLASCKHPALIGLVGMTDTTPFSIITEYMPKGSLFHDLHRHHQLDQTMKTIAAYDIARGMQYLHSRQIAHRDLKSLNVLIDKDNHARLCDFGFSRHWSDTSPMNSSIGTPHWMAPEILMKGSYTNKVDVYAYGVVLWEIATGRLPYNNLEPKKIIELVITKNIRPDMPPNISTELSELIKICWDRKPENRPSFEDIIKAFKTKKIFFPGTNIEKFVKYMNESATSTEILDEEIDKKIQELKDGVSTIEDLIKILKMKGIPPNSVESCWSAFENSYKKSSEKVSHPDLCDFLFLFAKTPKFLDAVKILRSMERNSVPSEVMSKFIKEMPTGNEDIDTNITIAACRNKAADLCSLYVTNPKLTALALDATCQTSIDPSLKYAVIDRCYTSIMKDIKERGVTSLRCAGIRCLLINHEIRRLPMSFVLKVLSKKLPSTPLNLSSHFKNGIDKNPEIKNEIDTTTTDSDLYTINACDNNEDNSKSDKNESEIFNNNNNDDFDSELGIDDEINIDNENEQIENNTNDDKESNSNDNIDLCSIKRSSSNNYSYYEIDYEAENSLLSLVILATAAASFDGVTIPPEVICEILNRWPDERAGAAMIAMASKEDAVDLILQRIKDEKPSPIIISILMQASKFKSKQLLVSDIINSMDLSPFMKDFKPAIDFIMEKINPTNQDE